MGQTPSKPPTWKHWLVILWAFPASHVAWWYIAPTFYLIQQYGWAKVWTERLHVVKMSKHGWLWLSNGDTMEVNEIVFGIFGALIWFTLILVPWILILPRDEKPTSER